jgi:hypothetical protein
VKIDRRRFGALTAAIAAAHCAPQPPPVVAVPVEDIKPPAGSNGASPPTLHDPGRPDDDDGKPLSENAARSSLDEAILRLHAQNCPPADNMKGSPGTCGTIAKPPGPTCESLNDTRMSCTNMRILFKPRVAEKAVACHRQKSGTDAICNQGVTAECAIEAIGAACADPTALLYCKSVVSSCSAGSPLSEDACIAAVSAVNDWRRQSFLSCIVESCRFEPCFHSLLPTSEAIKKTIPRKP